MAGTESVITMASRERFVEYLANHFRYYTMSSWNRSTSYARNVKIHHLTLDPETRSRTYEFLDIPEAFEEINELIEAFSRGHDYRWHVGFNGRSNGYLVLYRGGKEKSGYKTRCNVCGRLTWYETPEPCHVEACDGTLEPLSEEHYRVFTYPGKGVDDDVDFSEWATEDLEDRVRLIREFDRLCDACVRSFIRFVKTHRVEEREILVPKTMRVAVNLR